MKKIIFLDYGYESTSIEKVKKIKKAGFDGVFLFADADFDNNLRLCREQGLFVETIHLPFKKVCNTMWEDGNNGDEYVEDIIHWIKKAKESNIDKVIFHTSQFPKPEVSKIGIERFKKIVSVATENKIYLAVENLRHLDLMDLCLDCTESKYVVCCFDCGHANAFTNNINDYDFNKYKGKIVCLHLHDNDGTKDAHLPLFKGNINYQKLMKELKQIDYKGNLTLEIIDRVQEVTEDEYIKYAFESLLKLQKYYDEA